MKLKGGYEYKVKVKTMGEYTVSQDKNGYWYCHRLGFPNLPYFGSFSKSKKKALQFAADCMCMTYEQYMDHRKKIYSK